MRLRLGPHPITRAQAGFTLIEMLVVIAVVSVIAFISVGVAGLSFNKSQTSIEAERLASTIRLAQTRSISGFQDAVWGVHIESDRYVLFRGDDYATRDSSYDEPHTFPEAVIASGLTDIVFQIRTGETDGVGTVTLSHDATGDTRAISISSLGRITQ